MDGNDDTIEAAAGAEAPLAAPPQVAMKQRKNRGNMRKRATDGAEAAVEEDKTAVVRKAKQQRTDPLSFTTKKDSTQDVALTYASTAEILAAKDNTATKSLETETEFDRDARAQRERLLAQSTQGPSEDGKYRGVNSYMDYTAGFRREGHTVGAEKGGGAHGPLRGNVFVRTTARFDYQPDICKDYKETGFCSYGDSCKFMHDRGDYKSGWELEAEWEAEQKRRQEALTKGWGEEDEEHQEEEAPEDDLPFACYICRQPWHECKSDPVVAKCKHYFCETCALKQNKKSGKCAACDQPTQGIFNIATDVLKKIKKGGYKAAAGEVAAVVED
eukprot:gene12479-12613_t